MGSTCLDTWTVEGSPHHVQILHQQLRRMTTTEKQNRTVTFVALKLIGPSESERQGL